MASLKRNKKTQLNLMHMMKRNAVPPDAKEAQIKRKPQQPLRPTPHPTAPPFFKQPMPKAPASQNGPKISDDAWEVAERLCQGKRLTPQKRAFEDTAPVMEDSDDDFEPDVVTQCIARARPSSTGKSSTSALRDDRGSMTKRSGNKSRRTQPIGHIPSQRRSVFEQYGLPPKMASLSSSEDEDDDHVVVFEGEKSSLSGTENEDDRGVDGIDLEVDTIEPSDSQRKQDTLFARQREKITPSDGAGREQCEADEVKIDSDIYKNPSPLRRTSNFTNSQDSTRHLCSKMPLPAPTNKGGEKSLCSPSADEALADSPVLSRGTKRIRRASQEPRTIGLQKCSTGSHDNADSTPPQGTSRRRKIRPPFMSDTDSSDSEEHLCQERRRRGRLKSPISKSPNAEDKVEGKMSGKPSTGAPRSVFANMLQRSTDRGTQEQDSDLESSDLEIVPTRELARRTEDERSTSPSRARQGHELSTDGELARSHETPVRTPRNRKSRRRSTDPRRKSISEYIATASPSFSPPSTTKKRRRLRRLVLAASSEEENDIDDAEHGVRQQNGLGSLRQASAASTAADALSGTPRSTEWYHERDIDEFSESSCDMASRRAYVTRAVTRKRRRAAKSSPRQRHGILPVRRNISKSFEHSPDQSQILKDIGAKRRAFQARVLDGHAQGSRQCKTNNAVYDVDAQVIDLVDEDDEPLIASNEINPQSAGNDGSLSSGDDKIDSAGFDDDAPPPFNLLALCNDDESIREMKERLGEEYVIDKVTEARETGREIVGGEEIGLTGTYNTGIFDRFSKAVGADQIAERRAAKSVTEKALRGEYKFHYRGRERESKSGKQGGSSSWRGKRYHAAKYRRKRGSS